MFKNKILSLNDLNKKIIKEKLKKRKIILCHGVFDLLHLGHIKHFKEAKSFGDILVVTITPDQYVNKGPNRPAFSIKDRLEALAALESIDYVAENNWATAINTIKLLKPHIYCKGPDYKDQSKDLSKNIQKEEKAIKSIKGKIKYTDDITFSSSNILNKFGSIISNNQMSLIKKLNIKYNFEVMKKMIDELKKLDVLLIGESIIDQYY